jgi:hypothetical protein
MSSTLRDILACLVGLLFPYCLFLGFRPPFNLRLNASTASRIEKLSYHSLRPVLLASGMFTAAAAYADRHSESPLIFGLLLAMSFAIWLLSVPAGSLAFRQRYGWHTKNQKGAS